MHLRRILAACGLLSCFALWLVTGAEAQIASPSVRVDVPDRRPPPSTSVDLSDLVGGLFALQDGLDRSRQGFICALAYEDANGNGRRDRGEMGMPGWSFTITDATGATVASGATDGKGRFCNARPLAPGGYSVRQTIGGDWINTEPGAPTPNVKPVTLRPDSSVTVLFGDCRGQRCGRERRDERREDRRDDRRADAGQPRGGPGTPTPQDSVTPVCVEKFNDLNGDGIRQPTEGWLMGWNFEVTLGTSWPGTITVPVTTGAEGRACVTLPGTIAVTDLYQVKEPPSQPSASGWTPTTPGGYLQTLNLPVGGTITVTFGNRQTSPQSGEVCVHKYEDLDQDATRDPNEPPLAGWGFTLSHGPSGETREDGVICWQSPLGGYTVTEELQPGWTSTDPGGVKPSKTVYVVAGATTHVFFGNRRIPPPPGDICVTKYQDLDADGQRDAGEPFLPGWTFTLSNGATGVTNGEGRACFTVPAGDYTVTETMQTGWVSSDPGGANPSKLVTVIAGETAKPFFGNRSTLPPAKGRVCIVKYNDLNGNGARESFEPPLLGWTFNLKTSTGAAVGAITTAASPNDYCRDLAPGTYRAEEVMQTGWTNTDPAGASPQKPFTIVSGQTVNLVFGNRQNPPAPQLSIEKINDSGPVACGPNGVNNPCVFRIRITNIGTGPYAGPVSFSDTMRVLNLPPSPNSMALLSVGPTGWTCSATGAPMTCTGPVSLGTGQSVDVAVTFNFSHPVRPTRNCVTLTAPIALPEVCLTL